MIATLWGLIEGRNLLPELIRISQLSVANYLEIIMGIKLVTANYGYYINGGI